jgi:hypothetical protein
MSPTINKQLNDIFEELYNLFNDSIIVSRVLTLNDNVNRDIERHINEFMDNVNCKSEWNLTDEERKGLNLTYFEEGHNGVNAVYYPFSLDKELSPIKIQNTIHVWEKAIICIQVYSKNDEFIEKANELEKRIDDLEYY